MMDEWSLRNELFAAAHRWPVIVLFCLVGSLLGWGSSLAWRSPYQAEAELYVALNIYRAPEDVNVQRFAGIEFNYVDDYKNWQMANLNLLVYDDAIILPALDSLKQQDVYWTRVTPEGLRDMLYVYWRNAGKWRLVAENTNRRFAAQAAVAWQEAVVAYIGTTVQAARQAMALDIQMQANAEAQAQAREQVAGLSKLRDNLQAWQSQAEKLPARQPLEEAERSQAWAQVADLKEVGTAWPPLLASFPQAGAQTADYLSWVGQVLPVLGAEIEVRQVQIETLEAEQSGLAEQYAAASDASRGFSANLDVQKANTGPAQISAVRPSGLLALIGGALGLLAWAVLWLARLAMAKR